MTDPAPTPEVRVLWEGKVEEHPSHTARVIDSTCPPYLKDGVFHETLPLAKHLARLLAAAEAEREVLRRAASEHWDRAEIEGRRADAAEARAVSAEGERGAVEIARKLWQDDVGRYQARLARLADAARGIIAITDRKHTAWDALHAALDGITSKPTALEAAAHSLMQGPTATNICTPTGTPLYPELIGVSLEKLDKLREAEQEARGK